MNPHLSHRSILLSSLKRKIKLVSSSLLYAALLMYYAFKRKETPSWAKRIVLGALVYLFSPIDAIPDLAPLIGYTDDMSVMFYGLVLVAAYINADVRASALRTLESWIGPVDHDQLKHVDAFL